MRVPSPKETDSWYGAFRCDELCPVRDSARWIPGRRDPLTTSRVEAIAPRSRVRPPQLAASFIPARKLRTTPLRAADSVRRMSCDAGAFRYPAGIPLINFWKNEQN
jgi:hypothetical protein